MRWPSFACICLVLCSTGAEASPPTMGVAVQVSNGKPIPTQAQFEQFLNPGDYVRDVLGWQKADPHCNLVGSPTPSIVIPSSMQTLYDRVDAAGGKNFVTLAFNNKSCGQVANAGGRTFPSTPALRAEFAAYAAAVVRQVPALGGVSIWNEFNGTWDGGYTNYAQKLTDYCLLTNAVIAEIRKVDPQLPIAMGATVGWNIDNWFIDLFDKYGCIGKGDPNIWLDVHPYLTGKKISGKTDWQLWKQSVANIRGDGISNPLMATEWGAKAAYTWQTAHPSGNYMTTFDSQVLSQDPHWAGAIWFELLYDRKSPNAGMYDKSGLVTTFGVQYLNTFRN